MVGYKKPSNKILVAGSPLVQELKVQTAAEMYPGRLVKKGTNDDDAIVNTAAANPLGWLGYEQCRDSDKPEDVDTVYALGDWVPVLNGGNFVLVGRLASGQSVSKGAPLVGANDGELKAASTFSVSVPVGGTTVTSSAAQPNLVEAGAIPPEGLIVAIAEETVDASGAAADIMVRSLI